MRRIAVITLVLVAAAACGRDEPDPVGVSETTDATTTSSAASSTSSSLPDAAGSEPTTPPTLGAGGLDAGGLGGLDGLCGPGDAVPVEGVPGVEGTTVRVSTMADPGFSGRPGLNQEIFDVAEAMVAWCNEHGGVRGYTLDLELRDTALTEHLSAAVAACERDFFIVGSAVVFDDAGQEERLACQLPEIATAHATVAAYDAELALRIEPFSTTELPVGTLDYATRVWPDVIDRAAVLVPAVPSVQLLRDRFVQGMDELGFGVVYNNDHSPFGEANWTPFALAIQESGAELVIYLGEPSGFAALQLAARDISYEPTAWIGSFNTYDARYLEVSGDRAADTFVRLTLHPLEAAEENPATADYIDVIDRYTSGGKPAALGALGASAWTLFLQSLGSCVDAGTLDRDCVYSTAAAETAWTGGGLHAPQSPTSQPLSGCYLMVEATADGFVVVDDYQPTDGIYRCVAEAVAVSEPVGTGARCPSGVPSPLPSEC